LSSLVHKIFPHLDRKDEEEENQFYARRGIKRKQNNRELKAGCDRNNEKYESEEKEELKNGKELKSVSGDELNFSLIPDTNAQKHHLMPSLQNPLLRTSGRLKVSQLKKYLLKKLRVRVNPNSLQISCNGDCLGDELSLIFVYRTRWIHTENDLVLCFRFEDEHLY